ncbi:uroporphyrinogen-III synthase [Fluviicoccus keumensis]|uniref:Uroporphyrinogen-III synthase n=1 Tax=Fluviicoccus keumensis TaxID=1435465 RepID=A0A4Q7ZB21_9GAMM|nr:uroporphyrinogen-III synthase [Fluviicoccus keumensis]RZU47802.1 uroporphyrinogen-III synthase [Fluviicoccus keumensis]
MTIPEAADRPLTGLSVVNTRPAGRATVLDAALRAVGATVHALPLLETEPLPLSPVQRQMVQDLDRYRVVFVVSPTAAALGLDSLRDYWPQWPVGQVWIAVGAATARELAGAGLSPLTPTIETSEGVLSLPPIQTLQPGDRVLVLRGEGGRNLVRDWLQAKAVQVDYLDLYRRRLPAAAAGQWRSLRQDRKPDAIVLTSGESLRHWLALGGDEARLLPAVVISERLGAEAMRLGVAVVLVAASTRPEDVIAALRAWREASARGID